MEEGIYRIPSLCGEDRPDQVFWNASLTLNTSTPDLTVCFQRSVLLWVPCGWLWVSSLFYFIYLYRQPSRHSLCRFSCINLLKVTVSSLIVVDTLISTILLMTTQNQPPVDIMYYCVRFLTMVLATILLRMEYLKSLHSSGITFIFWFTQFICDIIILHSWVLRKKVGESEYQQYILYIIYFILVCLMFFLSLFSDKEALRWEQETMEKNNVSDRIPLLKKESKNTFNDEEEPIDFENKKTVPVLYTPFWKRITFLWMTSHVYSGYRRLCTFDSLYHIRPAETCRRLLPKFYYNYNKKCSDKPISLRDETGNKRQRTSFLWAVFMSGGYILIPGVIMCIVSLGFRVIQPFILGQLIDFVESNDPHTWKGMVLATALFAVGVMGTIFIHNYLYFAWLGGMRVRTVANAIIYRKALQISGSAKKLTTVGEILNLMSVDAQKLQDAFTYANLCWEVPVEIVVCTSLIWTVVGPSSLAGIVVLCILMPLNGFYAANWIRKLQGKQMEHKDTRMKYMSEIFAGIKIIKLYAWEPPFLEKVVSTRKKELYYLRLANIIGAISNTIWFLAPYMVSLAVFATFVLISPTNVLDPNKAFVTMSLINVMNFTLSILPLGVNFFGQAIVSVKRINQFLEMEELEEGVVEHDSNMSDALSLDNGNFSWEKDGRIVLNHINLHIPRGQLVAVVGHVGSGKTSLVSAILGEMSKHQGNIKLNGSLAYVPQQAWIQNASLRNNVIFGKTYNKSLYDNILDATALLPDLQILSDGDMTEIGEKGINLSGGQKQRVSLARAVYQNEDIYLLDDPLSAVDAHVGKHIFEKIISNTGLLEDKTRIFVTHSVAFLRHVDVIVVMNNGVISEMGPFDALIEQRGAFAEFLTNYFKETPEYSSDEEEDIVAIHDHLSTVSASESEVESKDARPRKLSKRKVSRSKSQSLRDSNEMSLQKSLSRLVSETAPMKLIEDEVAEEGGVRWKIIWRYVTAGGKGLFYLVVLFQLLFTVAQVLTSLWLSEWSTDQPGVNGTMDQNLVRFRLGIYGAIGFGQGVFATVLLTACALGCVAASYNIHEDMLNRLLRAPMSFFDTTPLGRIMNRCSKDMDIIDSGMPNYLRGFFFCAGPVVATAFVITYTTPVFLAACVPIVIFYALAQRMYITYVRQLKRIDNIRRSPIYAHFDESISGTSSIRAYGRQTEFITKCDKLIDESQRPFFLILSAQRWLGVSMETVGGLITFFAATFAVLSRDSVNGGLAGLSVSYALNITVMMNALIRCMTELETYMVSVERLDEYCHVSQEADWRVPATETDSQWPPAGNISIQHYGTRYRPGLDLVLNNLTCDIKAGEKIGIVGRTGAGKSSLTLALFRIIESATGSITIDGVPIANLGLHNLRSRLTVIPQDPVIFSGTLRQNLDPFSEYSETRLWETVENAHLKAFVQSVPEGLDYECGEGGESLSVGQRQLVCLGRALLRQTKVLVLDEATAAVDLETDALIQATIREMFKDCTLLTIAHRLATVMDYDRIMVLDKGSVKEFDSPKALLSRTDSVFHSLAREAGVL